MPGLGGDTSMGGGPGEMPATRNSAVLGARNGAPEERRRSLNELIGAYWKPVYKVIRARFRKSNDDAKELTQEFFTRVVEKDILEAFDPLRGRFRTFLMVCLQRFLSNEHRAARAEKRGGGVRDLSLDFGGADEELAGEPAGPDTTEVYFEREWWRHLLGLAVQDLRAECLARKKDLPLRWFERYDLADPAARPTYAKLAEEDGVSPSDVNNGIAYARQRFRIALLDHLRRCTGSDEDFRAEAAGLFGPVGEGVRAAR